MNRLASITELLPAKSFYFFYFAAGASLAPFLVLFYRQQGLDEGQIGLLAGMQPLMTLAAASLWGALADSTHQHRLLLRIALVGVILLALALSAMRSFGGLAIVVLAYAFFMAPIIPLVDNSVLELLGDHAARYGRIRLWGAVGWGIAGPVVGRLVDWGGLLFLHLCPAPVLWVAGHIRDACGSEQSGGKFLVWAAHADGQPALADLSGCNVCGRDGFGDNSQLPISLYERLERQRLDDGSVP